MDNIKNIKEEIYLLNEIKDTLSNDRVNFISNIQKKSLKYLNN